MTDQQSTPEATDEMFGVSAATGWPTTRLLPAPTNPVAVARELIDVEGFDGKTAWWRGDFYHWTGTHWAVWPDSAVTAWLYQQTEHALYRTTNGELPWAPNRRRIGDLREALSHGVIQRSESAASDDNVDTVAFTNGVLELATMHLADHDPNRFNLYHLGVDYSPDAGCPLWLRFLGQVLEDDAERIALLQEWFGYVLCGGTELQKIFSMYGPKRCGKGTVLRVLTALVGEQYVASPSTLDSLAGTFGLQKLIGTRLTVLADVQWVGAHLPEVVGILLSISGEDHQDIARKNRIEWRGKLQTRFMLAGNDRPKFSNASGALAGRLEHLQFRVSFYGREDIGLTGRLLTERAGIFNWALEGWRRLQSQGGRFTRTKLGEKVSEEVERDSSPVTAFVREHCVVEQNARVELDELHREYVRWRATEHLDGTITKPAFSRNLSSAFPSVDTERVGSARTGRTYFVTGIRLATDGDKIVDRADRADRALLVDHAFDVSAGQDVADRVGPCGPCISPVTRSHNENSTESTTSGLGSTAIGNPHGPTRSARSAPPLSSENADRAFRAVHGPPQTGSWSDLWDGFDGQEPAEAA